MKPESNGRVDAYIQRLRTQAAFCGFTNVEREVKTCNEGRQHKKEQWKNLSNETNTGHELNN
jgi:hypothetical protein